MTQRYLGAISGTSVDGLDLALVQVTGDAVTIPAGAVKAFPDSLAKALRALAEPGPNEVFRVGATDAALGEFIGHAALGFLAELDIPPNAVRAIGSHGQTIRHHPEAELPFTVQIGDANRIAEITGIDTVADFRRRDMAAGGEGAPLTPLFHGALFRHEVRDRVVLNLGGIANVTILPAASRSILGFDTGPANALMDAWVQHAFGERYDAGGERASGGTSIPALLDALLADPYLNREPPKSTGKETYNLDHVQRTCRTAGIEAESAAADVLATLAEFSAASIAGALARWGPANGDLITAGGGRLNRHLMSRIAHHAATFHVTKSDDHGIHGDHLEAAAFAWLAHRTLEGLPGNAPEVTGASAHRILGAIHLGQEAAP